MSQLTEEEKRWLTGLAESDQGNELALLAMFAGFRIPLTYLDIGCGTGAMVKMARRLGVNAWGVDILPHDEPYLIQYDLRQPLDLHKQFGLPQMFGLITSIETAEHIEPESADILCDTYARHIQTNGGMLVLTAAPPGQMGDHHVNCQPKEYWKDRLESRGLKYDEWATKRLFTMWEQTWWATHWCEQNLQVFHRYEVVTSVKP